MKLKYLFLLIVIVCITSAMLVWRTIELDEPAYQGRTLSEWVHVYFRGYSGDSTHATRQEIETSEAAFKAMGTNTIPILIAWLQDDRRSEALTVFGILGNQAEPAAPSLIRLTKDKDKATRRYALDCLLAVCPQKDVLLPVLSSLIHDPDKNIGFVAAQYMIKFDADAAKSAGVLELYPQLNVLFETNDPEASSNSAISQ